MDEDLFAESEWIAELERHLIGWGNDDFPPGIPPSELPGFALALSPQRPLEPIDRAIIEIVLRLPDEWTDQSLSLGSVKEAALDRLISCGFVEAVYAVTVSSSGEIPAPQSVIGFYKATGRECSAAVEAQAREDGEITDEASEQQLKVTRILHRLTAEGATAAHDFCAGDGATQNHALNWARLKSVPSVVCRLPGRPSATGTLQELDLAEDEPTVPSDSGLNLETHDREAATESLAPPNDALGVHSPVQPPEQASKKSPAVFGKDAEQHRDSKLARMSNEDRAIAFLLKTPHLTVAEVATMVGVSPKSPYRWKRFLQIHQSFQAHLHDTVRRGMKDRETGELTAIVEPAGDDDND